MNQGVSWGRCFQPACPGPQLPPGWLQCPVLQTQPPHLLLSLEDKRVPACSAPGSPLRPSVTTLPSTQSGLEGQQSEGGGSARHSCGLRPTWSVQALVSIQRWVHGCHGPSLSDLGPPGHLVPLPRPCCAFLSGLGEGWGEAGWGLKGVPGAGWRLGAAEVCVGTTGFQRGLLPTQGWGRRSGSL